MNHKPSIIARLYHKKRRGQWHSGQPRHSMLFGRYQEGTVQTLHRCDSHCVKIRLYFYMGLQYYQLLRGLSMSGSSILHRLHRVYLGCLVRSGYNKTKIYHWVL